jgi:DNA-binding GntR family transcriptional regulator
MDPIKIYRLLKEEIIWLNLIPESALNLSELAKSFGVSRTPIKEALIFLQADGWILRRGSQFIVTPLSLDRIKEITEIRSVLEIKANVWAMQRITPEELKTLGELRTKMREIKNMESNKEMVELDTRFHQTLYTATKNSQLAILLDRLLSHYLRFWLSIPRVIDPEKFFYETFEMIKAIESKDEPKLRAASAEHIKNSIDAIMGTF